MAKKIKILFADDEMAFRKIYGEKLESVKGFSVQYASNGQEALDIIKKYEPDIVVSDLVMPIMSGQTFLKELQNLKIKKKFHVIVLSALMGETDIGEAFEHGAVQYLSKADTSPQKLVDIIQQIAK